LLNLEEVVGAYLIVFVIFGEEVPFAFGSVEFDGGDVFGGGLAVVVGVAETAHTAGLDALDDRFGDCFVDVAVGDREGDRWDFVPGCTEAVDPYSGIGRKRLEQRCREFVGVEELGSIDAVLAALGDEGDTGIGNLGKITANGARIDTESLGKVTSP